jgi:pimeloyl-ACP methyl ester carboxylesterase
MNRPVGIPMLHIHGDADPYVLADPVERTQRYTPHGRYVSVAGAGHFSHEEMPDEVNGHLMRFLDRVYRSPLS